VSAQGASVATEPASQPCIHPDHRDRGLDWRGEGDRLICGVCHPRPQAPESEIAALIEADPGSPVPTIGELEAGASLNGAAPPSASARPAIRVESLGALLDKAPEKVPTIGGRRLPRGETLSFAARAGVGKTTLLRGLLAHAATGQPYIGFDFTAPVRSVYFSGEGSGPLWTEAMRHVVEHLDLPADALERVSVIEGGGACGLRLNRAADLDQVRRILSELKAGDGLDVAAFDPFQRFAPGDENSSKDMGAAVDALLELNREFDIATIVPHHASQGGRGLDAFRGHTTFEGAIATGLVLTAPEPGERVLEAPKVRYARTAADSRSVFLDFDEGAGIYVERPALGAKTKGGQLLEAIDDGDWHGVAALAKTLGVPRTTFKDSYVQPAIEAGQVEHRHGRHNALEVRRLDAGERLFEAAGSDRGEGDG
jgi:AAA domain-containing protein